MTNKVVIHQPDFISYIGFFHRLIFADIYVILDNVQFPKGGWNHRDKIKTANGVIWLTIPIKKAPLDTNINQIYIDNSYDWRSKHLETIKQAYKKAHFFNEIFPHIINIYNNKTDKLVDFNINSINIILKLLDINIKQILASSLNVTGKSNQLVVNILKAVNATHYISGIGAKNYFDPKPYQDANITVIWQNFIHPVYPQLHGEFVTGLSSIDFLLNCGIENSRKIINQLNL